MVFTVSELAALVGGQFASGEGGSVRIAGAAAISEAVEGEITFFGNPRYLPQLKVSRASAVLVPADFSEVVPPIAIRVSNASLAFAQLLEKFAPPAIRFAPGIHPSAVIAPDAVIGEGVSIQPFVVVEPGVRIGPGTLIGAHGYVGHDVSIGDDCEVAPRVTIGARCVLGDRVIIHSGTVLGSDGFGFELEAGRHVKIPQIGVVEIRDDVEIGANVTIDRARFGRTIIGEGTKIDNLVQIAHNVTVGKHCLLVSQSGVSGSTKLGNYVTLAGQVGVVGHIEIGDHTTVAAQSGVSKTLGAQQVVFGSPALPMRESKERLAYLGRLPKLFQRVKRLEQNAAIPGNSSSPES